MPENDSGRTPEENPSAEGEKDSKIEETRVPQGFTAHSSGLASEYARELGWGINEEERKKTPSEKQDYDGGRNYEYGARDFGDTATDASSAEAATDRKMPRQGGQDKSAA